MNANRSGRSLRSAPRRQLVVALVVVFVGSVLVARAPSSEDTLTARARTDVAVSFDSDSWSTSWRAPRLAAVPTASPTPAPTPEPTPAAVAASGDSTCLASWYTGARGAYGRLVGDYAASRDHGAGARVRVSHGSVSVVVTILDYGPARWTRRCIDLARHVFARLAPTSRGVIGVRLSSP